MAVILVVEDNTVVSDKIERIIHGIDSDIKVLKTNEGQRALKISQAINVDVFIIDIGLPDYDGLELAKEIRKTYFYHPIIIQSCKDEAAYQIEVHDQIENLAYLSKPYSSEKLIIKIKHSLNIAKKLGTNQLKIKQSGYFRIIEVKDILFIEKIKSSKKIEIYFYDQDSGYIHTEIFNRITLNDISDMLKYKRDLLRCHKGYIVNPKVIKKLNYTDNTISLKFTEYVVPIGKTYRDSIDLIL